MPLDRMLPGPVKPLAHQGQPKEDCFKEAHTEHAKSVIGEVMKRADSLHFGCFDWWVREEVEPPDAIKAMEWQIFHEVVNHIRSIAVDRLCVILKNNGPKFFREPGYTVDVSHIESKRFRVTFYRMTKV